MSAATAPLDRTVTDFVDAAVGGDLELARRIGLGEAGRSGAVGTIEGLLAPALRLAGDLWLRTQLASHGEHRVTSAVDAVLEALEPQLPPPASGPDVVVSTGDDSWHATAARLAGLLLRSRGWRTRFVGPALTAARLDDLLQRVDVDVVALSCTSATHLAGVGRTIRAVHQRRLPVVVGGSAFDAHPGRAARLGADAGPGTLPASGEQLQAWLDGVRATGLARPGPVAAAALELDPAALLREVVGGLDLQGPLGTRELRENLVRTTVDAWLSAVAVDDPALLAQQLDWVRAYLRARSLPGGLLAELAGALHGQVPIDLGGHLGRAAAG